MNNNKTPGQYGLPNETIEVVYIAYKHLFLRLLNFVSQKGIFSDCLKERKFDPL